MKKILIIALLFIQTIAYAQSNFTNIGTAEYVTSGLKNDKTVWTYSQNTITPTLQQYTGGVDSIVFIRGGQYHTQVINQRGRTTKLGNQHTSVTETFLDQFGAEFKDNFFVEPFYQCNVSIRGTDSSLWYWGISDPMNYSATEPITAPIALTMPSGKKFKKVSTGTNTGFNDGITFILALASDGTLWKYDKKVGTAGLTTPTNVTPAGETVVDFGNVSFYGYLAVTASNKIMARGVNDGRYVGQATHSTSWVDRTTAWGVTFPVKEVSSATWVVHIIDANDNLFGCGSNYMGNIGNGYSAPLKKNLTPAWQINIAANGVDMQVPVQIPGKFKNIRSSTSITFYHYVQDLAGNWYSWGRNKSFCLSNGTSLGPYVGWGGTGDYASYPNALDVPMPKRVNAFVTPYVLVNFAIENDQPPVVGSGVNQYISTATSTLYGVVHQQEFTITSSTWSKVSGPAGGTITSPSALTSGITSLVNGTYVYRLSATNSAGLTSTNDVEVVVSATNAPPIVTAGTDQSITLPTATTTILAVSASDPDGVITAYAWTKVSGPAGGAITSPSSISTGITGLQEGTYVYRITVTDDDAATGQDDVTIVVNPAPIAPVNTIRTINKYRQL